jgi:hypothetical protein
MKTTSTSICYRTSEAGITHNFVYMGFAQLAFCRCLREPELNDYAALLKANWRARNRGSSPLHHDP